MMEVRERFRALVSLTLKCIWFIMVALPIFMYLEKPPVSTYTLREITPKKVLPGDEITINIKAAISKDCEAMVYRSIVDSTGRVHLYEPAPRPNAESYPIKKVVPLGVYPGPAEYQAELHWACNWVQKWFFPKVVKQPPIHFDILPTLEQLPMLEKQGKLYVPGGMREHFTALRRVWRTDD